MKLLYCFFISTIFLFTSRAENNDSLFIVKQNYINLQIGYLHRGNRDYLVSPLKYTGSSATFLTSYSYTGTLHQHNAGISYQNTSLHSITQNIKNELGGNLFYNYHHYINSPFSKTNFFSGISFDNVGIIRTSTYFISPENSSSIGETVTFEFVSSLCFAEKFEYLIDNKQTLSLSLTLPFLSYIIRPEYNVWVNADSETDLLKTGKFQTLKTYQAFSILAKYQTTISEFIGINVEYFLSVSNFTHPQTTTTTSTKLSTTLIILF